MLKNRISRVRALLEKYQLDALFFLSPANLRYLCGFTGSEGALVVTAEHSCFLTDSRYATQASLEVQADSQCEYAIKVDGVVGALTDLGVLRVGFEANYLTCAVLERMREKGGERLEWVGLDQEIKPLRAIKDSQEINRLEKAAALSAQAFADVIHLLQPGIEEREYAWALEVAMRQRGGEEKSFDIIVASGERGALPHGRASGRRIAAGDLVTIDFGLRCEGYCSDETVTVAIGAVTDELRKIHAIVLEAQQRAVAAIRPGVPLREIDAVARDHIGAAGYGAYFGHGLGHGIGIEVHEFPTISPHSLDVAQEGMVFSVEPGIYLPGYGGVRIEDVVVVTADGCRKLTLIPKEYRQLP